MTRLGVVTGLPREAALLRNVPALVRCEGPGPARARAAAEALIAAGAETLASFGLAGALDPRLVSGDIVVATAAIAEDGTRYEAETRAFGIRGAILTRGAPVASVAEKRRLFAETGAIAVDMETAAVAAVAHAAGRPFVAARAIVDPASRALPAAAIAAMRADGRVDVMALLARPWEGWRLIALARDYARAQAALRGVGGLL
jgi:adenosylhomocysteine nucleosidase